MAIAVPKIIKNVIGNARLELYKNNEKMVASAAKNYLIANYGLRSYDRTLEM